MPATPDPRRSRRTFRTAAVALGLTLSVGLPTTSSAVEPSRPLPTRSADLGVTAPATTADLQRAAASAPHAVVPTVKQAPVPVVPSGEAPALEAQLGLSAPSGSQLVDQVTRPRVAQFSMVAVTWRHGPVSPGVVAQVRTRSGGAWSRWTRIAWDEDGPAPDQDSTSIDGTTPLWVDSATGVQVAVFSTDGVPRDVRVSTINPGTSAYDATAVASEEQAVATDTSSTDGTFPSMPAVITRQEWGVDPKLGDACWPPKYGITFRSIVVHHTAGSNDYTPSEGPAIVRGIYAYHTVSRHWCDIGYNFLVDKYGAVYEGRRGGMRRPVRGAHAGNYNVNTTGISLMGNFDIAKPTTAMKKSLISLIAWRLGTAYHHAYGSGFVYDRRIKRIIGHRDVMQTACPGQNVYDWLPVLRRRVQARIGDWESPIEKAWLATGGIKGPLGPVSVGEQGEDGGHHTTFLHGRMYKSANGLFTLDNGPVLTKFVNDKGVEGPLGYPESGIWSVPGSTGEAAKFSHGRIYWSPDSGAMMLRRGAILKHFVEDRAAHGPLGFPTSEVFTINGGAEATFENGTVTYSAATHQTTITVQAG